MQKVVITGAAGNLGSKLRQALEGRYELCLLDRDSRGDAAIRSFDLSLWNEDWARLFAGADTVVHMAANSKADAPWEDLLAPNIDALLNVLHASVQGGVKRVVLASSNHVMGGYQHGCAPGSLTTDLPPLPGARYFAYGADRDSSAYGSTKLFCERLGRWHAERFGLSVIALRLGWVRPGANLAAEIPRDRGEWFRRMWLSNRDFCQLVERCLLADCAAGRFEVVNGMSANAAMPWDLTHTRGLLGYEPQDGLDD
jgi:uronate dehydrogenase